ncbi:MAG: FtsX-like permease family protein [Bacteroidales bacterium]|nr:FtsX-like permease family protein [Bacteroidales bacterium]MBN2755703.1 FtsX-like permease family protein [Bacteroidales bacterium]
MNLHLFIAKRYLFAKKSRNLINIISGISILGVSIGTMALIIILSVFNGLDSLIKSFYNTFDPDFKVTIAKGKVFSLDDEKIQKLIKLDEIAFYTEVLEENALIEYEKRQDIAKIKGVSDNFNKTSGIDSMIISGEYKLRTNKENYAILGWSVANNLAVNLNLLIPLKIWVPKRNAKPGIDASNAFNIKHIFPIGLFSVYQEEYDAEYIIVPLNFAQKLLEYTNEVSSLEIKSNQNIDNVTFQSKMENILGKDFIVKNRFQQHEFLFKIMKSEKWVIYLILTFILIIASFNLIGSLTMLIIDKKEDIITLQHLGANNSLIRKIFLFEGWFISLIGAALGLIFGAFISYLQKEFGIIEFPEYFIVRYYPVEMRIMDFVYVFFTVLLIGFFASWYPVRYITKKHLLI